SSLPVENVLKDLARLERQDAAGANRNLLAGLRVATHPGVLVAHDEVAKAGDLDFLAPLQRLFDRIENRLDDLGGLLLGKTTDLLVDVLDDVRLGHDPLRFRPPPYTSHPREVKQKTAATPA